MYIRIFIRHKFATDLDSASRRCVKLHVEKWKMRTLRGVNGSMSSEISGIDQSGCHILSMRHVLTLVVGVSCPVCTRYTRNRRTCVKHTQFPFQHPIFQPPLFPFNFLFSPTDFDSVSSGHSSFVSAVFHAKLRLHPRTCNRRFSSTAIVRYR